jgi:hypothetical protein
MRSGTATANNVDGPPEQLLTIDWRANHVAVFLSNRQMSIDTECRDYEQIHRGDAVGMIVQKGFGGNSILQ